MPFSVFSLGLPALEEKVSGKERWVGCLKRDQEKRSKKGEKKESASEAAPRIILKWPLVNVTILVSRAGDISLSSQQQMTLSEYLKNVGLIVGTLIQFLCVTLQIARKSHFHSLHWKSEATIRISLLQNTQFMLSVPKMKAKLHPWLHSRLFVQLCSYVCACVRARMHMQVLQWLFYNFAGILSVFAVFPSVTKTGIKRYKAGSLP